jgi:hypothetical protein
MNFRRPPLLAFAFGLATLLLAPPLFAEKFQIDRYGIWDLRFPGRRAAEDFAIMQYPVVLKNKPDIRRVVLFFEYRGDLPMQQTPDGRPPVTATFHGKPVTPELRFNTSGKTEWIRVALKLSDKDIKYAENGAPNDLKVTLNGSDGTTIEKQFNIPGLTLTTMDQRILDGKAADINSFNYAMAVKVPPNKIEFSKGIPKIGEVGFGLQLTGKLTYFPFTKKKATDLNGGVNLKAGTKKYALKVGSKSSAEWKKGHWEYDEWKAYLAFSEIIEIWQLSFFGTLPPETKKVIEGIPFAGPDIRKGLEGFKASLEAEPTLTGAASLGLKPEDPFVKNWTLNGEMDLRLSLNMALEISALGKFGARALLGGKIELGLQAPATPTFPVFKGQLYVGADLYFACFESNFRYALLEFNLSAAPKSGLPTSGILTDVETPAFRLMDVPAVDETFPLQGISQAGGEQTPVSSEIKALSNQFRQLSGPAAPRATHVSLGDTPSDILAENSAVLPIVDNVTPLAWPAMAASTDSQIVIFGVDTREPNVKPANPAQFSKLMWTLCDANGNWSAPQFMPAGNGGAQMMASVAYDNTNSFLAVWQQMRDPNFQSTDPAGWMNQNEVVSAKFDLKTKTWTLQPLSTPAPGTADFSPVVSMNATMPDLPAGGLAVWLNGKIPPFGTSAPAQPDQISFHWSRYKDGQWLTPDFTTDEWRKKTLPVPKGLLSFDLAAIYGTNYLSAVLVYSFVAPDGATKLACRYFYEQFPIEEGKESQPTWGDEIIIADKGVNLDPVVEMRQIGSSFVVWNQDGNLVSAELRFGIGHAKVDKPVIIRPASSGSEFANLRSIPFKAGEWSGGKLKDQAIAWTEQTDEGPSIVLSVYDKSTSTWSEPVPLTPGDAVEMLYDLKADRQGNLMPLFVHTEVAYETVETKGEDGKTVKIASAPVPGAESIRVGKFKPLRAVGFAPGGLSTTSDDFMGGTTVHLTATVANYGILGIRPVTVRFYLGDPQKGGREIGKKETGIIRGATTAEASLEWKLPEDIWEQDDVATEIFAVLDTNRPPYATQVLNNTARLNLEGIRLDAVTETKTLLGDGSFTIEVGIRNSGFPHADPFPVAVYDYAGIHEIARVMVPRIGAGSFEKIAIEMPPGSASAAPEGKNFLVKVDPENTLKLPGHPQLEKKVHVGPHP